MCSRAAAAARVHVHYSSLSFDPAQRRRVTPSRVTAKVWSIGGVSSKTPFNLIITTLLYSDGAYYALHVVFFFIIITIIMIIMFIWVYAFKRETSWLLSFLAWIHRCCFTIKKKKAALVFIVMLYLLSRYPQHDQHLKRGRKIKKKAHFWVT